MRCDFTKLYTDSVGMEYRKEHGQFFTPPSIAEFMCRWVMDDNTNEVYDPAFGLGAIHQAAKAINPGVIFYASESDEKIIEFYKKHTSHSMLIVSHEDYLAKWGGKHKAIVCNPPYMRFQMFDNREEVFKLIKKYLCYQVSGYTNIASAFLIKSLSELELNGRLAYIMPLEFLNTGYGKHVKERLMKNGLLKVLIQVHPEKDVFPDVTTSVGIILVSNDGEYDPVKFYNAEHVSKLKDILKTTPARILAYNALKPEEKWQKYFNEVETRINHHVLDEIQIYGHFTRGIATGANEFFSMSKSKAMRLCIPSSALLRCITKSTQVTNCVFTEADIEELVENDANVLLLNVNGAESESVARYIEYGIGKGYHERYLTSFRNPWYKLEKREPAPLLFGVFSRNGYKVVRNLSSAVSLTCFHCFYPNECGRQYIDELFLYFQTTAAKQILGLNMRKYGDALEKFEPNDLNFAFAPTSEWFSILSPQMISDGVESCRKGQGLPENIDRIFDSLLKGNVVDKNGDSHSEWSLIP